LNGADAPRRRSHHLVNRTSELTYTAAWWVPGAHLQTLWGKLVKRGPIVPTRSERWTTPDDDELELHRLDALSDSGQRTPRLLLLHGLEGTIHSHYLRGTLAQAQARGWPADVLVFRGCNGEVNRARRMYHSGETTDLDFVVRQLIDENPDQPLVVAGFSLGGNVMLKWLGELGVDVPEQVRAAAAISVPYDLERGARRIEHGFSRVYTWHFLRTLRMKAMSKWARFPDLFDLSALTRARTLYDFDDVVTAPVHGFTDAHDYYSQSSSLQYLSGIRVPTLLLSALDDPFLPPDVLDAVALVARDSSYLLAEFRSSGGHVGFVSGTSPFDTHYYAEERVVEFLALQIDRTSSPIDTS
jgi:predicted alpha/beta-fold hydrolase